MLTFEPLEALRIALQHEAGLPLSDTSGPVVGASGVIDHRISLVILRSKQALDISEEAASTLERDVASHLLAASSLIRQTALVSEVMHSAGIDHMVIKGAALGALQGGVSSRGAGDIDLVVEPRDIARTAQALMELDYRPNYRVPRFDQTLSWRILSTIDRETAFHSHQIGVDLHWRISPQRHLFDSPRTLIARGQMVNVGGVQIPTVSPADALSLACFHAYNDRFSQLRALVDIHRLIPLAAQNELPDFSPQLGRLVAGVLELHAELFPGMLSDEIVRLRVQLPAPLPHVATVWNRHGADATALRPAKTLGNIWQEFLAEHALDHPIEGPLRFIAKRLFHFPPSSTHFPHQPLYRSFFSKLVRIARGTAS